MGPSMKPQTRTTLKRKQLTGYTRWKKQLKALNRGDLELVKKLAFEARTELEHKTQRHTTFAI